VAAHFATKRPVLGICLKRYNVSPQGAARRVNTYIDIPLEIRLPHFISDGSEDDGFGSSFSKFQLSLKSIICHRGVSLDTGHYVSIVRPTNEEISKFPDGEGEIEPKYKWLLFDDLSKERVNYVDVRKALKDECPYLVFYQVQLIDEYAEFEDGLPPSYAEATNGPPSPNSKFAHSEPTIGLPSTTSTSTIIGTSAFSTPALLSHAISAPDKPVSIAEASRADLNDDQSSLSQPLHSILAIPSPNPNSTRHNHATTAPVSAQSSPVAHPELSPPRPHSLDLSPLAVAVMPSLSGGPAGVRGRSPSGRASQESASVTDRAGGGPKGSLRGSVVFSDGSSLGTGPSAPVTPFDDALGISTGGGRPVAPEGYLSAKDASTGAQPPAASAAGQKTTPAKREGRRGRRRGRSKDQDGGGSKEGKEKETRSSRYASSARSWLPSRSSPRPRSQPPPAAAAAAAGATEANRLSVAGMSGLVFKGLREAMSRESKGATSSVTVVAVDGEKASAEGEGAATGDAAAEEAPAGAAAAVAVAEGAAAAVTVTDGADGGSGAVRSKRSMGLGRRKSAKKGKAKKETSPGRVELEGPDRQCVAM
jgi:Ubiquitin carboxyl-terminal hydrolase